MANEYVQKVQSLLGAFLLIVAIVGFVVVLMFQMPSKAEVEQHSQDLQVLPENFFTAQNSLTEDIKKLNVPSNVPVNLDINNLGRSNVFEAY